MRRQQLLGVLALALATCGAGCVARASASGEAQAPVTYVGAQTLVSVGSGVWVVRDSSRACYYYSDSYWVYREGSWYRSSSYASGWVTVEASVVPSVIVTRDHTKYVMYRGEANAEVRAAPSGEVVASTEAPPPASKHPHGGPPGQDDTPGLGNQKKAAGEQPGQVGASAGKSDGAGPGKSDAPKAKDEKPKDDPKPKDPPKAKEDPKPKDEPKGPPSAPPANGKDDKKKK